MFLLTQICMLGQSTLSLGLATYQSFFMAQKEQGNAAYIKLS